jgi:nucleotide-binding universal stress UspA family protein
MPEVAPPLGLDCSFEKTARSGQPVDEIIKAADEDKADLIVMATEGHNGFLDALRGSTTEQVLRRAPCPVLAIPVAAG